MGVMILVLVEVERNIRIAMGEGRGKLLNRFIVEFMKISIKTIFLFIWIYCFPHFLYFLSSDKMEIPR